MRRELGLGVLAAGVALVGLGREARADDAEVKKLVQAEIKAYMDKKKEEEAKDVVLKAKFKDGLVLENTDKKIKFKLNGRLYIDSQWTDQSDALRAELGAKIDDQIYVRRARLSFSGDLGAHVDWKIQIDFADPSDAQFKDAYITLKGLKECIGCWMPNVRVGQQWDPVGLETQSSSNFNTFIERAYTNDLAPQRALGLNLMDHFWKDRVTASLGIFSTDQSDDLDGFAIWNDTIFSDDGGFAVTGRVTAIPWACDTCHFLEIGASGSLRRTTKVRYRARPELGAGPRWVDTNDLKVEDGLTVLGSEVALVLGSLSFQGEYVLADVGAAALQDPSFSAWYAQASYFLTGEARSFDQEKGLWGNTKPCCNLFDDGCCCKGAWEVALRLSHIDLNDGTVTGGQATNVTAGVNWYWNANMRVMLNAIFGKVEDRGNSALPIIDEKLTAFVVRFDVHF